MKTPNLSAPFVQQLRKLKATRKSFLDFDTNFLMNFYRCASFMHYVLETKPAKQEMITTAAAQYIVSLVTCWETFFRDVFVYLYELDKDFRQESLIKEEVRKNLRKGCDDVAFSDYQSKQFNFQNQKGIEEAFSPLFQGGLFEYIMSYEIPLVAILERTVEGFSLGGLIKDWKEQVSYCLDRRHDIIHDANYRPDISGKRMSELETLFLLVPQVFVVSLIYRYRQEAVLNKSFIFLHVKAADIRCPYLFSIRDLLSDHWEITEQHGDEIQPVLALWNPMESR